MTSPILGLAKTVGKAANFMFLDAVLTREIPGDGPAYDPGPGTTVTYDCRAIIEGYSDFSRGQGLVAASDVKVLILASSLATKPASLDRIEIPERSFSAQIVAGDTSGNPAVSDDESQGAIWKCRCAT